MRRLWAALIALLLASVLPAVVVAAPDPAEAARTYGSTPLDDVLYWAQQEDQQAACAPSRDQLAAMMLAPTWAETGAPSNQAPSPMTLSRWDNQAGLHSFGTVSGEPRAFWHPGIGPWQFDSAGLGAPMTAQDRIDSFISAAKAADTMAARWCTSPSLSFVWAPWNACSSGACQTAYNEMYQGGQLTGMVRDASVQRMGGMQGRICEAPGVSGRFTCWRVDPARAQGFTGWTAAGFGPSPLTAPFYVYAAGGLEYRHWRAADTGYANGIWATRPLGSNARTSLTWHHGNELVDHGAFVPCPELPVGYACSSQTVSGSYVPVAEDFDGDGFGDILWYGPGPAPDFVWWGGAGASFVTTQVSVSSTYRPITGDFDRDGRGDVFWYAAGTAADYVWWGGTGRTFTSTAARVTGTYTPVAEDFDGDGFGDILWYAAGSAADSVWWGRSGRRFTGSGISVNGTYRVAAGDFDGDGASDVMWHAPGSAFDFTWWGSTGRTFASTSWRVNGSYHPFAADLDGDGPEELVWYGHGTAPDVVWPGDAGRTPVSAPAVIEGTFVPLVGDFDRAFADDVVWYAAGSTSDWLTISN